MSALQELQNYTFVSKYARWLEDKQRRETWKEAVERVKNMMHTVYADKNISDDINWAYDMMYKKKVLGSQRGLQFGGEPILKRNSKIFNCTASYCDRLKFFQECFWLLLCGSGTGFSVQKHHVAKLPNLTSKIKDKDQGVKYVIEDSIEGWADALGVLLSSYFVKSAENKFEQYKDEYVIFDYSEIRPQGSTLSSGVGKAPGFEPLQKGLEKIRALLDRCVSNYQKKLRPIDAYDIVMHSSDAVLSGGVRRSASLALFSPDDEEMTKAKTGNWYLENPQRARSNNSALLLKNDTSFEQFKTLMESVKEFGEPGFIWAESTEMVFNPCVEVNLYPVDIDSGVSGWQGCVMGDTPIITKNGMLLIKDSVGKNIEIWNGREWSTVSPTITGKNREMYRVIISDGSYLDCTDNHKWIINNKEIETKNIVFSKKKLYINRPNISDKVGRKEDFAYEYGFILGDGTVRNNHSPSAQLFKDDNLLNLRCSKTGPHTDDKHSIEYYRAHFIDVDNSVAISIKNSFGLPSLVFEWDEKSILEFMAGWIDADGTKANNGCRLYGEEDKIRYAQILLTSVGIHSSINLHSKKGTKTNISVRKKDLWYLQIPNAKKIPSRRIDLSQGKDPVYKGSKIFVRKIEKLEGEYTSYCFEEPKLHNGTFGNILTKQCNLSTINCSSLEDEQDFYDRCKAAAIIGTLQAGFTKLDYLGEISCKIFQRESLLGVSLTGIMEKHDLVLSEKVLKTGAKIAVDTNKEMAKKIGINQAARVTCLKPEGCLAKETMVTSNYGILSLEEMGDIYGDEWQSLDNTMVATDKSNQKASNFFVNGHKPTKIILTSGGIELESTLNHKFRTLTEEGQYIWKTAEELSVRDILPYRLGAYSGGSDQTLNIPNIEVSSHASRLNMDINLPNIIDTNFAWFLGLYTGDGSNHPGKYSIRIHGDINKQEHLIKAQEYIKSFGIDAKIIKYNKDKNDVRCALYITSRFFYEFLRHNDLLKQKSHDITIPLSIRKSSCNIIASFIDGYAAADGCTKGHTRSFCTTSKLMASQLIQCLRAIGIDCKMRLMPPTSTSYGSAMRYWIQERLGRNSEYLNKNKYYKYYKLLDQLKLNSFGVDLVVDIRDSSCDTYDISVDHEDHTYLANSYVSHNTSSSMLGTSSGIHPHHAKRYIRHVQANILEAPYQHFKVYNPQACEKSCWSANNTDEVIKFPIEVPDGSKLKNQLPAVDMLEIVKNTQKNWVQTGKNTHLCTQKYLCHNVSNTVTVKPEEWKDVTRYIYDNRKYFAGISLIPQSGDKDYTQAPFTTVYTSREIVKEYGDAALWCSGLIELALQAFDNNVWASCDYVSMNQAKDGDSPEKLVFITKMKNFAGKYFDGDIKRLTYCMKDVYNWKIYCDLIHTFKKVDYTKLLETEDNTVGIEEVSCAGGACLI